MNSRILCAVLFLSVIACIGCERQGNLLTVDYADSLEQAIQNANIDLVNPKITSDTFHKNESEVGKKTFETCIFTFQSPMSAESVKAKMKARGFRAASLYELLAYANAYPMEENENLVALGSVWAVGQTGLNVATFKLRLHGRTLNLFNSRLQPDAPDDNDGLFSSQSWFLGLKQIPEPISTSRPTQP